MKLITSFILCLFMMPVISSAQESNIGNWVLLFGNKKFSEKVNWHHELQYRNYNFAGDLEQLLVRTGIGMNVRDNANVLLGYGFIRSENYTTPDDKAVVNEHRIYQQFITKQNLGRLKLQHRYRFEQRFVEDNFRLRFRYFLGGNISIWKKPEGPKEFYLSFYDEIFLNTVQNAFDRNRLYGGLGYKLNDSLKFELGYMNQFLSTQNRDQFNMVCFFNW